MSLIVHRVGAQYRLWRTVTDCYEAGPPMGRAQAALAFGESYPDLTPAEVEARMARADRYGTSGVNREGVPSTRDTTAWEWSTCPVCGYFHHAFTPSAHDPEVCDGCGDPREVPDDLSHAPACSGAP